MGSTFVADFVEGIDAQWAGQVALSVLVVLVMMISCKSKTNKSFERRKATWQRVDSVRARNNDELSVPQTESQLARYKSRGLLDTFRTYEEELKIAHGVARSQEKDVASIAAVVGAIFLYFFWRQVYDRFCTSPTHTHTHIHTQPLHTGRRRPTRTSASPT